MKAVLIDSEHNLKWSEIADPVLKEGYVIIRVKAAGGIRDADSFLRYVELGAERIGCSAGIPIMTELRGRITNL